MIPESAIREIIARQDHLYKNVPGCPVCHTHQVQIIDKEPPAQWRCRLCWHRFEYEPPEDDDDASVSVVPDA